MNAKIRKIIARCKYFDNYIFSLAHTLIFIGVSLQHNIISFMLIDTNYFTDEGHYLDYDDLVTYFRWKIYDLLNEGHSNEYIANYLNNEIDQSLSKQILI